MAHQSDVGGVAEHRLRDVILRDYGDSVSIVHHLEVLSFPGEYLRHRLEVLRGGSNSWLVGLLLYHIWGY